MQIKSIGQLKGRPKLVFKPSYPLMQIKSIAEWEHSAILSTFIKLPFNIKIFVFSIFEGPLMTGFTVSIFELFASVKINEEDGGPVAEYKRILVEYLLISSLPGKALRTLFDIARLAERFNMRSQSQAW